jgi:hypothetical protein
MPSAGYGRQLRISSQVKQKVIITAARFEADLKHLMMMQNSLLCTK